MVLVVKNLPANEGDDIRDKGSIPLGRPSGGGHGNPLQYSCLENPMDRWAWWATVHRVARSGTWLKWLSTHASTCTTIKSCCWPSITPWKEFGVDSRNETFCAWGKTGRTGLQTGIFRSWFYEPSSCISPWKGPKILHGGNCSLWLAKLPQTSRNLLEKNVPDCMYSPFTKITYILTLPHCLLGAASQSYLRCCLLGCILILPQIKLNSQLLCCAFFKSTVNDIFAQTHTHTTFIYNPKHIFPTILE